MIINKLYLQNIIKEELQHLLELKKIPVLEGEAVKFDDPLQVLKAFRKQLTARGYDVSNAKKLGGGFNGIAYSFGNEGKVLKISIDDLEARTANYLKGKTLEYVIPIDDVFQFPTSGGIDKWYGIIEHQAKQPSKQLKVDFDRHTALLLQNLGMSTRERLTSSPWYIPWETLKKTVLDFTKEFPEDNQIAIEAFKFLEKLEFNKLLDELRKNKVEYFDVHSGNFMFYNGKFVLVDLGGNSQSPGELPKMIERKF